MQVDLLNEVLEQETRVWQALVSGDGAADAALLSPDFLGVYSDGFAGRDAHAGQLADGPTVASFELSDARVIDLSPECAMLSYAARFRRVGRDREERMFVSSIWRRQAAGGWINLFSQDTPAVE
ncbi:nuclear transport factor 2 family protein [Ruegeria sp. PrR005]|uniref:Nuclear transport factor 2 family protein n=1 Tax=Ruegeria sp. PrR005 TaxID=2706882 RepID=A0A6B2NZR5_9RHOB|nr:nuclear transport factor 2 family protein [Ruegeria sp. PrR005]NDW47375.1 nuclear transport factor 2 family protein [Ruegeria sp. PrR005]